MTDTKTCKKCGHTKPRTAFEAITARGKRTRRSWCRPCMRDYWRAKRYRDSGTPARIVRRREKLLALRRGEQPPVRTATELGL